MSGAGSFVERHGLWTKEQHLEAKDLLSEFKTRNIEVVRFSFPDQHGILRGKTLTVDEAVKVLAEGGRSPQRCSPRTPHTRRRSLCSRAEAGSTCRRCRAARTS